MGGQRIAAGTRRQNYGGILNVRTHQPAGAGRGWFSSTRRTNGLGLFTLGTNNRPAVYSPHRPLSCCAAMGGIGAVLSVAALAFAIFAGLELLFLGSLLGLCAAVCVIACS